MRIERPDFATRAGDAVLAAVVVPSVGILVACAGMALFLCGDLVWTDVLHTNPNRTAANVGTMMLHSPVYGLFLGVFLFGLPVAVGGLLVAAATVVWRRPSCRGMAIVSAVTSVLFVRWCYAAAEAEAETREWRLYGPPWSTLVGGSALLTAALYAGWRVQGWLSARVHPVDG